jgi:hypothetical protein
MNMQRRVFKIATKQQIAEIARMDAEVHGLHPEVYLRSENIEHMRISVFVVMVDDLGSATHGKNAIEALPVIPE